MREIDEIRALERQMAAIAAGAAAQRAVHIVDRRWLAARAHRRRNAGLRVALRRLFGLPLALWRRLRSAAIPSAGAPSAGLRGR